jgi:hypothetical protein
MPSDFKDRFGEPRPPVPTDIRFRRDNYQRNWERILRRVGSGWFMNRFLYLFGAGLQPLTACLEAWSFLVPPGKERIILGRNAYGTLLVLEEPEDAQSVYLLDPLRVVYWTDPDLELLGLIGREMPRGNLPHFFEDELYRAWIRGDDYLPDDTIIAPIKPLSLGGTMDPKNFQEEEIVSYYRSTAPVYAKAFARMAKTRSPKKPRKKKR